MAAILNLIKSEETVVQGHFQLHAEVEVSLAPKGGVRTLDEVETARAL